MRSYKFYSIIIIILIASINLCLLAFKTDCKDLHWGTKTLYQPLQKVYSNPPEGYKPVFINYVGRHGARHLTSITADSILFLVLKMAENERALTNDGEKLKQMDSLLLIIERGNVSFISERGKEEQESIGNRMSQNFSSVFADNNGNIKLSTTKKERTKQSAKAFFKGLNLEISHDIVTNYNSNDELAFYDVSPSYKSFKENGNWKTAFDLIQKTEKVKKVYEELPKQFFTPSFVNKLNSNPLQFDFDDKDINYNSKSFVDGLYDACSIVASLNKEIKAAGFSIDELDFNSLVSCSSLEVLNYIKSSEDFLLKGPGTDNNGIQVRIAAPLLLSFINTTDEYISSKKVIANLRFGHAETIAPFAALLDLTNASEPILPDKITDYNKTWKCENIIPLSSNIQLILYENKSKEDYIVKFLLNEKEVNINGLKASENNFYYKWSDIKAYYINKLNKMNIHSGDNIHDYLLNVK